MRRWAAVLWCGMLSMGVVSCQGRGWTVREDVLFDGRETSAWKAYGEDAFPADDWVVEDGTLRCIGGGRAIDLATRNHYQDFEFHFEFKLSEGANSGVVYRSREGHGASWQTGPEYQVLDDASHGVSDESTSVAGLYALYEPHGKELRPIGDWNEGRVVVVGNHVEHWLNGVRVVDAEMHTDDWYQRVDGSKFGSMPLFGTVERGRIVLQDHGNDVWYRNLKVVDRSLAQEYGGDPVALFDGSDLSGWTIVSPNGDASDTWRVEDGVLICSGTPTGYIHTQQDYANFILELDWRWSPETQEAGNSGVLFRLVGEHKVWPQCFEAQLKSGSAGDVIGIGKFPFAGDPARTEGVRQAHTRPMENPPGEWNHYRIISDHGKVTLEVNGEIINEAWKCPEQPSPIALQSEGTEIHFRNIVLTPLP